MTVQLKPEQEKFIQEKNVIWLLGFQIWAKVTADLRQTLRSHF